LRDQISVGGFSIHQVNETKTEVEELYQAALPNGVSVIDGWYYLLGPYSLVVVFTFRLNADTQLVLDRILRTDVVPRLDEVSPGSGIQPVSVIDVKRQNCSKQLDSLNALCQHWANDHFPGTLNHDASEPIPVIPCVTTREEAPFQSGTLYQRLVGLAFPASVMRLSHTASVLMSQRLTNIGPYRFVLSTRESDFAKALRGTTREQLPALMQQMANPLIVAYGLDALVRKLDKDLRNLRAQIIALSVSEESISELAKLRIALSALSRTVSTVRHEFRRTLVKTHMAWDNFPAVELFELASLTKPVVLPVEKFLNAIKYSSEELGVGTDQLIEQSSIMASAIGDSVRIDQDRTLRWLNRVLVALTVVLIVIAVVTGIEDHTHNEIVHHGGTTTTASVPSTISRF
jgi:hypothetical protein